MSCCMCCLEYCTQVERPTDGKDEPVVDIDRIVKAIAWDELLEFPPARLSWRERLCPLSKSVYLEIDKAFLHIWPQGSMHFDPPTPTSATGSTGIGVPKIERGTTVLFQSSFENNTDSPQTYSFRTERQTRSFVELSLQRGFTVGTSLEVDCKMPTGLQGCEVSGKLGGQLQWSFSRGKTSRQEEQVTWSVDNNILVGPNRIGTASLMVTEYQWSSDFTLPCVVRALPHPCPSDKPKATPKKDAGRAKAILQGKDSGPSAGPLVAPGRSGHRGGGGGGGDDTRHYDDHDRDRIHEEEEEADEVEREESRVLTSYMSTTTDPDTPPPPADTQAVQAKPPAYRKTPRPKIPVFVRRKSNGEMLKVIYVPCSALVDACPEHFRLEREDTSAVMCELRGRCHVVCATEQRVRLEECLLAATPSGGYRDGGRVGGSRGGAVVEEYMNDKPVMSYRDRYMNN